MSMMRNLFGGVSNFTGPLGNIANLFQKFAQFRQNPVGTLMTMGINVPQNLSNNPEAIVNYLRSSGQMSEQQFDQFSQLAQQFNSIMPR